MMAIIGFQGIPKIIEHGSISYTNLCSFFYLDGLSILLLNIILFLGFMASIFSVGYLNQEYQNQNSNQKKIRSYYMLMQGFLFTMIVAMTVNNLGILWVAIEGTTLASAFLVGFHNDRYAIEAAWKYVIICSVGIAIALLGIIFVHLSSVGIIEEHSALNWIALTKQAASLDPSALKIAFIFAIVGFGTKTGIAPLHTWLPDAHSQAPSPISALLSGVLLNTAFYAILRIITIVNKSQGGHGYTFHIMAFFGILSILTATVFILTQKDYKRLLAYSSIEHMGIIVLSVGLFTPLSVFAGLFHMVNHSLTKFMLFLTTGNILQKYGTKNIDGVRNLLTYLPVSGTVFLLGIFAISGAPPFSIFSSEVNVFLSIFSDGHLVLGVFFILLLALVFVGVAVTLFPVFYGKNDDTEILIGESNHSGGIVLIVLLLIILVMGFYLPPTIEELLQTAQQIILGG